MSSGKGWHRERGFRSVLLVAVLGGCSGPTDPGPIVMQVSVTPATSLLTVGDTVRLVATPVDGTGRVVQGRIERWTSEHPDIADVSPDGLVTGLRKGAATIHVTVDGVQSRAEIMVLSAVATINLSAGSGMVHVGETLQLSVTLRDASGEELRDRTVSWASSDTTIIRMVHPGLVIGVAPGVATVTAAAEKKSASAPVTAITASVGRATVEPDYLRMKPGTSAQLSASVFAEDGTPLHGRPVTWESANSAVVRVDGATGLLTAVHTGGPVAVTATCDGVTAAALVTVSLVEYVLVNPSSAAILPGTTIQLSATAIDARDSLVPGVSFAWASADPSIAVVDASGLVTGVSLGGPVTITVTAEGEEEPAFILVTTTPVERVTVTPTDPVLPVGGGLTLSAVVTDLFGNHLSAYPVVWSVSDPGIATVSDGTVTAWTPGVVTVTATAGGKVGTTLVTVAAVHISDLGTLGGSSSSATAINDLGHVVGESRTALGAMHGFYWSPAVGMSDLGTLGGAQSRALAISDADEVYGVSETASGEVHAFRWTMVGGLHDLGPLTGIPIENVLGMSSVGYATGVTSDYYYPEAFVWDPVTGLRTIAGGNWSRGLAINDLGQVAGSVAWEDAGNGGGPESAFVWSESGGFVDLGEGTTWSVAAALNHNGQVAGSREAWTFRWSPADGFRSFGRGAAYGISRQGRVVGEDGTAFVWTPAEGRVDLGVLPGGIHSMATCVNDAGQAAGWSEAGPARERHAALWTH